LNTVQKKSARSARGARTPIKAAAHPNDGLGIIESAYDKAKGSVSALPKGFARVARADYVLPVAIGSFLLGAAATALGVFLAPKLRQSGAFATMKNNLQSATASVSKSIASAMHDMKTSLNQNTAKHDMKEHDTEKPDGVTRMS
jgi:hypothetical protein